jgi:hypothetical protein
LVLLLLKVLLLFQLALLLLVVLVVILLVVVVVVLLLAVLLWALHLTLFMLLLLQALLPAASCCSPCCSALGAAAAAARASGGDSSASWLRAEPNASRRHDLPTVGRGRSSQPAERRREWRHRAGLRALTRGQPATRGKPASGALECCMTASSSGSYDCRMTGVGIRMPQRLLPPCFLTSSDAPTARAVPCTAPAIAPRARLSRLAPSLRPPCPPPTLPCARLAFRPPCPPPALRST